MNTKSKTILSIILLAVGAGLIPTGFFLNQTFRYQVYQGVPDALLGIQDEAEPSLEEQLPVLGTPDVLLGVEDQAVTTLETQLPPLSTPDVLLGVEDQALDELEDQLPVLATPDVLKNLRNESLTQLPAIINASGSVEAINTSIYAVYVNVSSLPAAIEQWFNNASFSGWYPPTVLPQGPSEYTGAGNLSFTVTAQNRILYGYGDAPGLLEDELGIGLLSWMEFWSWAFADIGSNRSIMESTYNSTWASQLQPLGGYISNYLWDVVVKSQYSPPYTIEQYSEIVFYSQWANGTLVEDGIDLSLFRDTLPSDTKGLEAGVPNPTNLTLSQCTDLWDESNQVSFLNDTGIQIWAGALQGNTTYQTTISTTFSLSPSQLNILLGWLGNFIANLVPLLLEDETGFNVPQLAQFAFYEQWANGTIQGEVVLPNGFLAELNSSFAGPPYFEVGIPTPSNLSLTQTMNLWDESNPNSFVNDSGVLVWVGAAQGNTTLIALLNSTFGLDEETSLLVSWFGAFLSVRVPQLLEYETGYTVPELAQVSFYEQWANGTIQGEAILPDGFLAEIDTSFAGAPYFEVGLPNATALSLSETMALWDESNELSFVNGDGITTWVNAIENTTLQASLISEFSLSDTELALILGWLGEFLVERVPQLLEYETGYTVPELAQLSFYEQWANGTIQGEEVLPDGFLAELDPPILGPPYFEVGLTEGATGLSVSQVETLWDVNSEYSLVSSEGINTWYQAATDEDAYNDLKAGISGITDDQMEAIIDWLPKFRDTIVNKLAKSDLGLPAEPYDLGNTTFIGLASGGGALALVGAVLLVLSRRR